MLKVLGKDALFYGVFLLCFCLLSLPAQAFVQQMPDGFVLESELLQANPEERTFDEIRSAPLGQWQKASNQVLNFAIDTREHWLKIRLTNQRDNPEQLLLLLDQPLQDYIDYWQLDEKQQVKQQYLTGDRRSFSSRPLDYRGFAFPVYLKSQESTEIYIRLDTHDGLYEAIPIHLLTGPEYHYWATTDSLWYGFYYGALLILLAYNLIIGLMTRERDFYLYSLYLGFFFIWNITFRGYGQQYFWQDNTWFANQAVALTSSGIFISLSIFTIHFLRLKNKTPGFYKLIAATTVVQFIAVIMAFSGQYASVFALLMPAAAVQLILILGVAVYRAMKGSRPALIFSLAWGILIISALIYFAQVFGMIPANSLTSNILNIGSLFEMLVLALALVDKINQMKRQQTRALEVNLQLQQDNNSELERLVDEKTAQLTALNEQLKHDAITDALTGLYNRRKLPQLYENKLEHCSRLDEQIGFILLDIDHFKQVNDRFGHQDGDQVLIKLSEAMTRFWQDWPADLFRFGGEEFGIITCHKDRHELEKKIQTFQQHISNLSLHHSDNITISVGAVMMPSGQCPDLDQAIAVADGLLYDAKNRGRNLCYIRSLSAEDQC